MHFEALKIAARANPGDDTYEIPLWLPENAKTDWRSHLQADDAPLMRFNNQLESEYSAGAIFPRLLDHARHIELYAVHPTVIAGVQGVLDNFLDKAIAPAVTRLRRALFPVSSRGSAAAWLPCTVGETTAGSTHAPADHPQAPQGGLRDGCRVWSQVRVCQCVAAHGVSGTGR